MNISNTLLTNPAANEFFGHQTALNSLLLETTLRYIAVQKSGGDISGLKPIKLVSGNFNTDASGYEYVSTFVNKDTAIHIFTTTKHSPLTIENEAWTALDKPPCSQQFKRLIKNTHTSLLSGTNQPFTILSKSRKGAADCGRLTRPKKS